MRLFACLAIVLLVNIASAADAPKKPNSRPTFVLPEGAIAFHFNGGPNYPNFKTVREELLYNEGDGFGWDNFDGIGCSGNGRAWPFGLADNYLWTNPTLDKEFTFRAKVANGEYYAWVMAGPLLSLEIKSPKFTLTLNDAVIVDETLTPEQYNSEKYFFRFMNVPYSDKPHFVWNNFISKMFPVSIKTVKVTEGELKMRIRNQLLVAVILVPTSKKAEFDGMDAMLRKSCQDDYESREWLPTPVKPQKAPTDGDYLLYVPKDGEEMKPWSAPLPDQRSAPVSLQVAGVPGERIALRIGAVPFKDLGSTTLSLGELKGSSGSLPVSAMDGRYVNFTVSGIDPLGSKGSQQLPRDDYFRTEIRESILLPGTTLTMENGISQFFWVTMHLPEKMAAGLYHGVFTFKPTNGKPTDIPVELEVYPFSLEQHLPVAFGMYGVGQDPPLVDAPTAVKLRRQRLDFLRSMGMTAIELPTPSLVALKPGNTVELDMAPTIALAIQAKEAGLGMSIGQTFMQGNFFQIGRWIGYRLIGKYENGKFVNEDHAKIDVNPGMELTLPGFAEYFKSGAKQYKEALEKVGVPFVVNAVDEPREKYINAWNRNFNDSVSYLNLMHEIKGLTVSINPMADADHYSGTDYTLFIDHVDVLSTHPWKESLKLMQQTVEKGKTLWLYNAGMDRFSWGFYNWRSKAKGRWEWHFCYPGVWSWEYYQGQECYCPFNDSSQFASLAPYTSQPGGMLYQSLFLQAMEGIRDYTYLYTLSETVRSLKAKGAKSPTLDAASGFLDSLDALVPAVPELKGMTTGAAVGQGLANSMPKPLDAYRKQVAEYLKELRK